MKYQILAIQMQTEGFKSEFHEKIINTYIKTFFTLNASLI